MPNAVDIVKALVSPCEKLISATQAAIGKAYEPRYIRRMADAKAYEIRTIRQAMAESSDVPIVYDKGNIYMDTTDFEELAQRTQSRLGYQELRKQVNIEAVVDIAYNALENEPPVIDEPIDQDWLIRFFNSVEDISNEQMQYLWGKILAGEIKKPNSFSMRTLNILKNLTQKEAELFKRIAPFILTCPGNEEKSLTDYFLPFRALLETINMDKYDICFPDYLALSETGIMNSAPTLAIALHLMPDETDWMVGSSGRIKCHNNSEEPVALSHSAFLLTEAGKELYPIIISNSMDIVPYEYLLDFQNSIIAANEANTKDKVVVSIEE